jgi:hypothetical protein
MRPRICSTLGLAPPRVLFCSERKRVRTPRFWLARASDCRERLAADLVFAILLKSGVDARADRRNVKMWTLREGRLGARTRSDFNLGSIFVFP